MSLPALVPTEVAPSLTHVAEACREALYEAGIFPIPRFIPELAENHRSLTLFYLSPHRARN